MVEGCAGARFAAAAPVLKLITAASIVSSGGAAAAVAMSDFLAGAFGAIPTRLPVPLRRGSKRGTLTMSEFVLYLLLARR
jgi:hypothetical protein